ncbi:MAG: RNA polymerase sigma factor [bacterium]
MDLNEDLFTFLDHCCEKNREAWEVFVNRYGIIIYHYIIRTLKRYGFDYQDDEVDDIFNSVFLELLNEDCKRLRDFRRKEECSFLAYLRMISFRIIARYINEKESFVTLGNVSQIIPEGEDLGRADSIDLKEIILILKENLPKRYIYLFKLIYEEGLDFDEIAEIMNMKQKAVYQLKIQMIENIQRIAKQKRLYSRLKLSLAGAPGV